MRRRFWGVLVLLGVTAAVIGGTAAQRTKAQAQAERAYEELLSSTPVAELEGERCSPDGRYEVRTVGKSKLYVSGVVTPEKLQIVDTRTGEVRWEDMGYVSQSALWSPDGKYLALAYSGRTWTAVKFFETDVWTSWDFTLPDGSAIPEYTFLPEDWGAWVRNEAVPEEAYHLLLTVGRGGDGEEAHTYRCSLRMEDGLLTGSVLEQTTEVLPGEYDFDHDGEAEAMELVTVLTPDTPYFPAWYELNIQKRDGTKLWTQEAALPHVGWVSLFVCEIDGEDYLLRYLPWAGQGYYAYEYQLFSLSSAGEEVPLRENRVEFDMMFGSDMHLSFDPAAIAAFLEEVHSALEDSTLLLTTEHGEFRTGGSGGDFREDMDFWDEHCPYDENRSLEENLRRYEAYAKEGIE